MDGLTRIYARNCEVRRITKEAAEPFFAANHQLGYTRCRYLYGLFVSRAGTDALPVGTLVAAAGFSNPRKWVKDGQEVRSSEWVRYASLKGLGVDGGMGKTLKAFIEEVHPDDVMSYADASWSDGDVYRKLGFIEEAPKIFPDGSRSLKFRLKVTEKQ
ncbi:MAG: hypothetical protein MJY86_09505 [Bacteroidales bacterium]|nr:hypothetical protein [Bacteroidales bacterium]